MNTRTRTVRRDLPALFRHLLLALFCAGLFAVAACGTAAGADGKMLVYIGTYAAADEDGIHVCELDMESGELIRRGGVRGIKNPSFQALHPNRKILYSVSETESFEGRREGAVSALAIDESTGMLTLLNQVPALGQGPCHLLADQAGKNVVVANYGSGSLAVVPIQADGSLDIAHQLVQHEGSSVNPRRQAGPHAHCVNIDTSGRFIVSADLGLDKVLIYRYDADANTLTPNPQMPFVRVAAGAGPRHFAFHPSGAYGYVINELNSTVTVFAYDGEQGTLTPLQNISTLPEDFSGENSTAEIAVASDGRFLYGSNRGHDSIAVFSIDADSGQLTAVSHHATGGEQPRNFGIDPTGTFLLAANQRTGNVVVFRIDRATGQLTATEHQLQLKTPVCVTFLPR